MKIFVSHSASEIHIAEPVCSALENAGNNCFIAPRDIRSGFPYAEEIANGIDSADLILLMLSEASNQSPHVLREIERAVTKSKPILVYRLSDVKLTKSMEYFLKTNQWLDAQGDDYSELINAIANLGEVKAIPTSAPAPVKAENNKRKWNMPALIAAITLVAVVVCAVGFMGGQKEAKSANATNVLDMSQLQLGDTFTMGSYNGEDIYWRVLHISEDGTEAVAVSRDVLSVKAYDAPESGKFNHDGVENYDFAPEKIENNAELQAYVQGNSSWENSTIRTWLNSNLENVIYEGKEPASAAMADDVNGYNNEKGFLCSFTDEELAVIKDTAVETKGNALATTETIVTQDKVYLLSMDELAWFEESDVSLTAMPTNAAVENDKSSWYNDYCIGYGVKETMWWLREPVTESASQCYLVGNGYYEENIYTWEVGVESFGIRPAMTIDLTQK